MTRISEIHGIKAIPPDEWSDRGQQVKPTGYVPYLSLTTGEMQLQLAKQRADILAQWYGSDAPQYAEAARMLGNALNAGIHAGGALSVAAIPDALQNVARLINAAKNRTAPASGSLFYRVAGMKGIGAIIPSEQRKFDCLKAAKGRPAEIAKCGKAFAIEEVINKYLDGSSHHILYKSIPKGYTVPLEVAIKRAGHRGAVEGMAQIGNINDYDLMYEWVENGVLATNAGGKVGPIGSVQSSLYLAPDPDAAWSQFKSAYPNSYDKWTGINGPHIGIAPAIAAALVGLVVAAIGLASKMLTDLQKVDFRAMAEAKQFGTPSFGPDQSDWPKSLNNPEVNTANQDMLMLALLAGGVYLLSESK